MRMGNSRLQLNTGKKRAVLVLEPSGSGNAPSLILDKVALFQTDLL